MKPVRTINFVARQTGLSVQVIRVWEKRYGAVQPVRADNNRRLYTEEDVERLRLLARSDAGRSCDRANRDCVARGIAAARARNASDRARRSGKTRGEASEEASRRADRPGGRLRSPISMRARSCKLLDRAAVELGSPAVLQRFIAPLAERVGELWRAGDFTIAHEHFASTHITDFLATFARPYAENICVAASCSRDAARPIARARRDHRRRGRAEPWLADDVSRRGVAGRRDCRRVAQSRSRARSGSASFTRRTMPRCGAISRNCASSCRRNARS